MIFDPFGIYSSFADFTSNLFESPERLNSETAKLENQFLESLSSLIQNRPEISENYEKDLISMVRKNSSMQRKNYLFLTRWVEDLINGSDSLDEPEKKRILFWFKQIIYPLVPSNFLWSNPVAVSNLLRTDGESIKKGYKNFLDDISNNRLVRLTKEDEFKIGVNIAATEGDVVFKNELFELIQYKSVTEENHRIPVVLIQPWINKYYIFDLKKETSFVNYLIQKGFTVFITSWKNPDINDRKIDFEDYIFKGLYKAIETANSICETDKSHVAGYCIGGTALVSLLGTIFNNKMPCPVSDISLFATLIDFSTPGEISYFITEKSLKLIGDILSQNGYLDGEYISGAFRSLKPDSLIWPYFSNNYLIGAEPPASDLLFWNTDSTGLPEKMCLYYLEEFYLNNNLIKKDKLRFKNLPCDISKIDIPVYAVGAEQDHIAPFRETIKIFDQISSDIKFILSDEGHITGFVNPPIKNSKKKFRIINNQNDYQNLDKLTANFGSWWDDWIIWLKKLDDGTVKARAQGNSFFPPLYKAPGKFVLE